MTKPPTFVDKHGLGGDDERRLAADIMRRVEAEKLRYVRLAWSDTHGYARAKTLTVPAFLSALSGGYNVVVATTTLDSTGGRPGAPGGGWILGDEYFNDGTPFHFAPRQLLRKALHKLAGRGCGSVIGGETEWDLFRLAEEN